MMKISGTYSLANKTNAFLSCAAQHYADSDVEVYTVNGVNDGFAPVLAKLYKKSGVSCVNEVDDMFLAVVSDLRNHSIHIFSDISTSILNMYYTVKDGVLFYSTSLKELLTESGIERRMNLRAAKAFIANGYVFGEETLIENVFKLRFGCETTVEKGAVTQKSYAYKMRTGTPENGQKKLMPVIRESIVECLDLEGDICMPLSGGFDSNMILDTIRKNTDRRIQAFTVGGKTGKSEIDAVKQNVTYMNNIELHTEYVDTSFYESFSDIVWRLDGSVFESGVFLQYALARAASASGAKYLVCGESSDEIQSIYYYESMKRVLDDRVGEEEKFFTYADPFIGTNMLVLKKSSLMLNSFGIVGRYPFKNKQVAETASAVAKLNGTGKKYYKEKCRGEFAAEIAKNLKTTGGTTNSTAAVSTEQLNALSNILASNKLIKEIDAANYPICATARTKKLRRKQSVERAVSEIKDAGLIKGLRKIQKLGGNSGTAALLKKAYLLIFHELFISGKYDDSFKNENAPAATGQIMNEVMR